MASSSCKLPGGRLGLGVIIRLPCVLASPNPCKQLCTRLHETLISHDSSQRSICANKRKASCAARAASVPAAQLASAQPRSDSTRRGAEVANPLKKQCLCDAAARSTRPQNSSSNARTRSVSRLALMSLGSAGASRSRREAPMSCCSNMGCDNLCSVKQLLEEQDRSAILS